MKAYRGTRGMTPLFLLTLVWNCPDRPRGQSSLLFNGQPGLSPGGKAAGAWSWPLTSI